MDDANLGCLSTRHLELFGTIVQWFARHELLMQDIMATATNSDAAAVMVMTRTLDFAGKRQTLIDLLRHRRFPLDQADAIRKYLVVPHTLAPLRDDIAHSAWRRGEAATGIQPDWILKTPLRVKAAHGGAGAPTTYVEDEEDRAEYSLEELKEIAGTLASNYIDFVSYLEDARLISKRR